MNRKRLEGIVKLHESFAEQLKNPTPELEACYRDQDEIDTWIFRHEDLAELARKKLEELPYGN